MAGSVLTVGVDTAGRFVVLRLGGQIDFSTAAGFCEAVMAVLARGAGRPVVLDFSGVSLCDLAGLSVLAGSWELARAAGWPLLLAGVPAQLRDVLLRAGPERLSSLYDTAGQGVAALA